MPLRNYNTLIFQYLRIMNINAGKICPQCCHSMLCYLLTMLRDCQKIPYICNSNNLQLKKVIHGNSYSKL